MLRAIWTIAALVLATSALPTSVAEASDRDIPLALRDHISSSAKISDLRQSSIPTEVVRTILVENLHLRKSSIPEDVSGTEFRFTTAGQPMESHTGLLLLSFRSERSKQRVVTRLARLNGYFKDTKILTRFSIATVGCRVAITFTENAGDEHLVHLIDQFPATLTLK